MKYDVQNLFDDEFHNAKWTWTGTPVTISWSVATDRLESLQGGPGFTITKSSAPYMSIYQEAFRLWDDALDSVRFVQTNTGNHADVTLGITNIDGRNGTQGQFEFTSSINRANGEQTIKKATINFDESDIPVVDFLTLAMHEIGNVLGLGDFDFDRQIQSVQRDGLPEAFEGDRLWDADYYIVRSWYNESTGPRPNGSTPVAPRNEAPEVSVVNLRREIDEDINTNNRIKIADIVVSDDGRGSNQLSLAGSDASMFQIFGGDLYLRAGVDLDHGSNPRLDVTVRVDDSTIPGFPEDSVSVRVDVNDVRAQVPQQTVTSGNDTIRLRNGNETINTGNGFDTVIVDMDSSDAVLTVLGTRTFSLEDRQGNGGVDRITNAEKLVFNDRDVDLTDFRKVMVLPDDDFRELAEMYVAYFNRAADAEGLYFWAEQMANGMSLNAIANQFYNQPETRALYGTNPSTRSFVEKVYENVLGRDPDAGGMNFWQSQLNKGAVSRGEFVLEIIKGAKSSTGGSGDAEYLAAKTDLGLYFSAIKGMSDTIDAASIMREFGSQSRSDITGAKAAIDTDYLAAMDDNNGDFLIPLFNKVDVPFDINSSISNGTSQDTTSSNNGGLLGSILDIV